MTQNLSSTQALSAKVRATVLGIPFALLLWGAWLLSRSYDLMQAASAGDLYARSVWRNVQMLAPYIQTISLWVLAVSAAAMLLGGAGLWWVRRMGEQAMHSREALLRTFKRGQALFTPFSLLLMVLLFCAASLALLAEFGFLLANEMGGRNTMKFGMMVLLLIVGLIALACRVLWRTWRFSRDKHTPATVHILGQVVTREQAPRVWQLVERVAASIGAPVPDHIAAGLNEGFFVTEHPVKMSHGSDVPPGRTLYLPLPYMDYMTEGEVASVIGHELAHFQGEDTVYSLRFAPLYHRAVNALLAMRDDDEGQGEFKWSLTRPVTLLGEALLESFDAAVTHWGRAREMVADQSGVAVAGRAEAASALLRIVTLSGRIDALLDKHWDEAGNEEGGFLVQLRNSVAAQGLGDPRDHLQDQVAHPMDTHPTVHARLQAMGVELSDALLARAGDPHPSTLLAELGLEADADHGSGPSPSTLAQTLQQELRATASTVRDARIAELRALADKATQTHVVHQRSLFMLLIFLVSAALLMYMGLQLPKFGGKLLFGLFGLGLLLVAAQLFLQSLSPVMTVTPEGLQLGKSPSLLRWTDIDDIEKPQEVYGILSFRLQMKAGAERPTIVGSVRRIKYKPKPHAVFFTFRKPRKWSSQELIVLLADYLVAGHARGELERMGAPLR